MPVFAAALLVLSAIATDGLAQRRGGGGGGGGGGGLSAEERAFLESLSQEERREIRSLDKSERGAFVRKRMARQNEGGTTTPNAAASLKGLDGFIPPDGISEDVRLMVGKMHGRDKATAVAIQKARGAIETGLVPAFIGGAACPEIDSEKWAIDYSHKRPWPAIHKGVDIPQPKETPIRAVADGTVVGKFENAGNRKGIEVMLRHTPEQTGLPFWTYSQFTHLEAMSPVPLGAQVKMGQEIGRTSNTGKMGRRIRRDALHFAILYSRRPEWSNDGVFVTPKDGYWMDPNAFYRVGPPYDSQTLAALPDDRKLVPVPYMKSDGSVVNPDIRRIWPYSCE